MTSIFNFVLNNLFLYINEEKLFNEIFGIFSNYKKYFYKL